MDKTTDYDVLDIDQLNEETEAEESLEQDETEEVENESEELDKLRSENKKLVEIIKRRKEKDAQKAPSTRPEHNTINEQPQSLSREEAILVASGYSEDDLNYLNVVAKGTGLGIKEAKEHPIFEAYLQKQEAERKARKARMGASKGSSVNKPVTMSGMSAEDHRKAWEEKSGF